MGQLNSLQPRPVPASAHVGSPACGPAEPWRAGGARQWALKGLSVRRGCCWTAYAYDERETGPLSAEHRYVGTQDSQPHVTGCAWPSLGRQRRASPTSSRQSQAPWAGSQSARQSSHVVKGVRGLFGSLSETVGPEIDQIEGPRVSHAGAKRHMKWWARQRLRCAERFMARVWRLAFSRTLILTATVTVYLLCLHPLQTAHTCRCVHDLYEVARSILQPAQLSRSPAGSVEARPPSSNTPPIHVAGPLSRQQILAAARSNRRDCVWAVRGRAAERRGKLCSDGVVRQREGSVCGGLAKGCTGRGAVLLTAVSRPPLLRAMIVTEAGNGQVAIHSPCCSSSSTYCEYSYDGIRSRPRQLGREGGGNGTRRVTGKPGHLLP